jgi:pyruvate formate lyase activating enzyme
MKIFGIVDISTIDYPKMCSAVVFLSGCNMLCGYCHNYEHMLDNTINEDMSPKEVFNKIDLIFADALVISGGEPTLQPEGLKELCKLAKNEGLAVKIDTNGTNVDIIKDIIDNKLINYVALDVKCGFDKYEKIANYDGSIIKKNTLEIINYCILNDVFIECRTTFVPDLMDKQDIIEIAKTVKDCNLYTIQQMDCHHSYTEEYQKMRHTKTDELMELGKIAEKYVGEDTSIIIKSNNEVFKVKTGK